MLKIAITGNIASGKSEVEKFLSKDFPVYDTDKIAHTFLDKITDFYGYDVFTNGKIDRKKLGDLVFSNLDLKKKLEQIIHPQVKKEILKIFEQERNKNVIFISVPLLFETGLETLFDKILIVTADENIRLNRLMARNKLTKQDALNRIKSQLPQETKIKKADFIIKNNQSVQALHEEIDKFLFTLNLK